MRYFLFLFLLVASLAHARTVPAGMRLAATCANCHGTNGVSAGGGMGSLAGMPTARMQQRMAAFRRGEGDATVMHQLARGYTEEEIALIAAWFAAQKAPAKGRP